MRLLLDTHTALWFALDDPRLSGRAAALLEDRTNERLLSAAVVWEIAIKCSIGKLQTPPTFAGDLLEAGALPLPVSLEHAEAVAGLPLHHRDPFDRLLVAQAQIEGATIVSADPRLRAYDVPVAW